MIKALLWHGICTEAGTYEDEDGTEEAIIEYVPLPDRIYPRNKRIPIEIEAVLAYGGFEILSPRGMPIRIRSERDMRRTLSTPGARQTHVNRERAYQKQVDAEEARRAAQQKKEPKMPKWMTDRIKAQAKNKAKQS